MNKQQLKNLIKEVMAEAEKLTPEEAAWGSNVTAKQIYSAIKANPIYKGIKVSYLTKRSEGGGASVFAYIGRAGGANPYVFISVFDNKIRVKISDGYLHTVASREFTDVDSAIKYTQDPLSVFKSSKDHPFKGATITKVIDLGEQGMELVIATKDGKQIAGKFHIKN